MPYYNVICYADYLFLTSTSVVELQTLIDKTNGCIVSHGVRFNPTKTGYAIFRKNSYTAGWYLNSQKLSEVYRIQYLDVLSDNPRHHAESGISTHRRAFIALQGAGLCKHGTDPDTIRYMWMSALCTVLTYGVACLHTSPNGMDLLEKCRTKLLKAALSLKTFCRNTPLLQTVSAKQKAILVFYEE